MDHSGQPSRRLGERRRRPDLRPSRTPRGSACNGRIAEVRLEAEADNHLLRVGRRRAGPAGFHGMGRNSRRRIEPACRCLHQLRLERSWLPRPHRLVHAGKSYERCCTQFGDRDFVYGRALAQTGGSAVMRLADADLLPFEFGNFADTVQMYVRELKQLSQKMQDEIRERNRELDEGLFAATADPKEKSVPPKKEDVPPHLNFAPLENAADALSASAGEYTKAFARTREIGGATLASISLADVNKLLMESERKLLTREGLPNRPWYRHQLYAPGFYTGYAAKTVPAVREAIEQKQWKQAEQGIGVVARVLQDEAALISSAAQKLSAAH